MKNYFATIKHLSLRILLLMSIYSFARLCFLLFNLDLFADTPRNIARAFVGGLRFDISAIAYTNLVLIALHLVPGSWKYRRRARRLAFWLFVAPNALLLLFCFADIEYYTFINKRSTWDLFQMSVVSRDVWGLLPLFARDYWHIALLWAAGVAALWRFYPGKRFVFDDERVTRRGVISQIAIGVLILGAAMVAGRGGLQRRPINMLTAARYARPDRVALVQNTTFTIINTLGDSGFKVYNYHDPAQAEALFRPWQSYPPRPGARKNVVLLILESFGAEYSQLLTGYGTGYMPFVDSLMRRSLYFTDAYANGRKSIEALPSIVSGLPKLMENPFITSQFASNRIASLTDVLRRNGYRAYFFHGGANGTMGFDNFMHAANVDRYLGLDQYPGPRSDLDGAWGVFDEPYLRHVARTLDTAREPFFAGVFTLSSHHPYTIPAARQGQFPAGALPIHESVGYADNALRLFFDRARRSPWFANTLFVVTADHAAQSEHAAYGNARGMYRVPLFFHDPADTLFSGPRGHVAQQADIFPTVVHRLGLADTLLAYGSSLLSRDTGWAATQMSGVFQLVTDSLLLQYDGDSLLGVYRYRSDSLLRRNLAPQGEGRAQLRFLQALMQDYTWRMKHNRLAER